MRKPATILAVFSMLHATVALGTTRYLDNSCAQNGNGTTTTCGANGPWNNWDIALSNCGASVGGDVIEVRAGTGVYRERTNYLGSCKGSAGNPIIIQNYANENVLVEGTHDSKAETWTARGGGVYECTGSPATDVHPTNCSAGLPNADGSGQVLWHAWYSISSGAEQELILDNQKLTSCTSGSETNGHLGIVQTSGNLCVNINGSIAPSDGTITYFRIPFLADFAEPFVNNGHDVTIRKHPSGGSFAFRRFRNKIFELTPVSGYTIDGLTLGWVYDRCLDTGGTGNKFLNNTVSYCGQESIRLDTATGGLVQGNDISHNSDPTVFPLNSTNSRYAYDNCTPIRLQTVTSTTIKGNTIRSNCGGGSGGARAIDLEGNNSTITIDSNLIASVRADASFSSSTGAILISSTGTGVAQTWSNNLIKNNRIYDVDKCFGFDGQGYANTGTGNLVANNTCAAPKTYGIHGYSSGFDGVSIDFKNNIFIDTQGAAPTGGFVSVGSSGFGGLTKPVYGAYSCSTCGAGATILSFKGTTAVNTQASVVAFDANSGYGTINVNESGTPPSLQLTACGDIACNKGTTVANVPVDCFGTNRPQPSGGAYDIGAHEFSSGGVPPPPTLISVQPVP